MKILFLTNELKNTCGITSHLYNLCVGLKKNEVDFEIACGKGEEVKIFRDAGLEAHVIPQLLHEKRNVINFITAHVKLLIHLLNGKYDLVHSHHHYCANIAKNVCRILSIKTVQTNHGILPNVGLLKHFSADYFIAVNDHIYDYLVAEEKISGERISLIYSGIWEKENRTKERNKKIKFIAAARHVEQKGIQDYIHAVSLLDDKYFEKAEFYIAGKGDYETNLRDLKDKLASRIIFLGDITNLADQFYEYDVLVMTSRSEGLSMVMIEAAYAECVVISSQFYGLNKLFNYENGCITYNCGDYQSLSQKIAIVIDNYDEAILLAKKLHKIIIKNFNARNMVNSTIDLYKSILNKFHI
ncbi:MAG: glycosyltransferase family 4 protein [Melioribacteraceae bacterium]